jgi:GNAT superfamily N-acetyltransferase
MEHITIRQITPADYHELADLIHVSTNHWYQTNGRPPIFPRPDGAEVFTDIYEALDPGCCFVAQHSGTGRLAGSCFYHPRPTHVSLGIMNVHPRYFGLGVARKLLAAVTELADARRLPVRLVSSAMNLDSFSLYTRAGFVPRTVFQDMLLTVPAEGLAGHGPEAGRVRPARIEDVEAMAALEEEVSGIRREHDFRFFIENRDGRWHVSVLEGEGSGVEGFLASVNHPGSNMLGPGVMRTERGAEALIVAELNQHRGRTPVFLVPAQCADLVRRMYALGAKNCELHFAQVRGAWREPAAVVMPTFMPESG